MRFDDSSWRGHADCIALQRRCGQELHSYRSTVNSLNTRGSFQRTLLFVIADVLFRLPNTLWAWYSSRVPRNAPTNLGFELLKALLTYDPTKRLTARDSLVHPWWSEAPKPHAKYVHVAPPAHRADWLVAAHSSACQPE